MKCSKTCGCRGGCGMLTALAVGGLLASNLYFYNKYRKNKQPIIIPPLTVPAGIYFKRSI